MSARDDVLASVRGNLPGGVHDLPAVPLFDDGIEEDRVTRFGHWLELMGGTLAEAGPAGDPMRPVKNLCWQAEVVCSTVPELHGNRDIATVSGPHALQDVDVAIVRAAFGVAETGSVLLVDEDLGVNALAYLAQRLVVLLDPADILLNMHHAYRQPEFHSAPLCLVPYRTVGHGRHRGRADPRRPGRAITDRSLGPERSNVRWLLRQHLHPRLGATMAMLVEQSLLLGNAARSGSLLQRVVRGRSMFASVIEWTHDLNLYFQEACDMHVQAWSLGVKPERLALVEVSVPIERSQDTTMTDEPTSSIPGDARPWGRTP